MQTGRLTLRVVALGPVVAGPGLAEHEVVRPEQSPVRPRPDAVHGAGLQVHQHGPGHVLPSAGLVVVDIDALQLEVGLSAVGSSGVNAVLVTADNIDMNKDSTYIARNISPDNLPEFGTNLVAALASLDMNNFSHDGALKEV